MRLTVLQQQTKALQADEPEAREKMDSNVTGNQPGGRTRMGSRKG
jgi:hypothetical protein